LGHPNPAETLVLRVTLLVSASNFIFLGREVKIDLLGEGK
jgi:hypothetical protein